MKYLLLALLLISSSAIASTITWVNPTQREDGKPLTESEIAGYRVYHGAVSGDYQNQINITGLKTTAVIDLPYGVNYIVMTVVDTQDRESLYSTEVIIDIPASLPKPPTSITIQ